MRVSILIYCLLLIQTIDGLSQSYDYPVRFWKLTSYEGEVRFKGLHQRKYTTLDDFSELQKTNHFSGGLGLTTKSYIWHPDFLQLDIGGEYFPESNSDDYLVTPDRSEVRTIKGLNLASTLLNGKPITFRSYANLNDSYSNRENITDVRTKTGSWGGGVQFSNKILPFHMNYHNRKWNLSEIETGRAYLTEQENFEASAQRSFTERDQTKLIYTHNRYYRQDASLAEVSNTSNQFRINNRIYLDKKKQTIIRSNIYNLKQQGSQNINILNISEFLQIKLPSNFSAIGSYVLYNQQQESQKSVNNKVTINLENKLYSSLRSNVFYSYSGITHSQYSETRNTTGFNMYYTKKIPKGRFNFSYNYSLLRDDMDSDPSDLEVFNEEHQLTDGEITILNKPYIDWNTIVVKDVTGTIIYQLDFDYILIEQGDYTEIQRVPGGQIPNLSPVYVDYIAVQTGSYKFDAHSNNVTANILLFNRFLELYYRGQFMNYKNVEKSDLLVLNYIKRNTFGTKLYYWNTELGLEYEYQNSTISPYKLLRFYLNFQKKINRIILSLYGNIRDYNMLEENINRKYSDLSGKVAYEFKPGTKLDLLLGYRHQAGSGIDLDLFTASTEFKTVYRKIYMTVGVSIYLKDYLEDTTNYYNLYLELARRF